MKRNFLGEFLGLTLSAVLALSSSVPSFAAEEISDLVSEEAVFEEVLEEFPEDVIEETEAEEQEEEEEPAEEVSEEVTEAVTEEVTEEAAEEEWAAVEETEDVFVEEEAELEEESLTEEAEEPVEEPVEGPAEEPAEDPAEEPEKEKEVYDIIYDLQDGELVKEVKTYKPGKRVVLPKAKKEGYKFLGWMPEEGSDLEAFEMKKVKDADKNVLTVANAISKKAKADVHLTAVFEAVRCKLYIAPNAKGVYADGKPFKKKQFIGVFDYEGNLVKEGTDAPGEAPEKKGSIFCGYALKAKPKSESDFVSEDDLSGFTKKSVTLYCIWEQIEYHLAYENYATVYAAKDSSSDDVILKGVKIDAKADDYYKEQSMYYGKQYKTPKVSIPGCTFVGWVIDSESEDGLVDVKTWEYKNKAGEKVFDFVTQVNKNNQSDILLRAVFFEKYYTLTFNTNGGVFTQGEESKNGEVSLFESYAYPNPREGEKTVEQAMDEFKAGLSREGYTLKGLYLDPKGKKKLPADLRTLPKKTDDKITIYAVWQKNKK